jgi:hypothetical protein
MYNLMFLFLFPVSCAALENRYDGFSSMERFVCKKKLPPRLRNFG